MNEEAERRHRVGVVDDPLSSFTLILLGWKNGLKQANDSKEEMVEQLCKPLGVYEENQTFSSFVEPVKVVILGETLGVFATGPGLGQGTDVSAPCPTPADPANSISAGDVDTSTEAENESGDSPLMKALLAEAEKSSAHAGKRRRERNLRKSMDQLIHQARSPALQSPLRSRTSSQTSL